LEIELEYTFFLVANKKNQTALHIFFPNFCYLFALFWQYGISNFSGKTNTTKMANSEFKGKGKSFHILQMKPQPDILKRY